MTSHQSRIGIPERIIRFIYCLKLRQLANVITDTYDISFGTTVANNKLGAVMKTLILCMLSAFLMSQAFAVDYILLDPKSDDIEFDIYDRAPYQQTGKYQYVLRANSVFLGHVILDKNIRIDRFLQNAKVSDKLVKINLETNQLEESERPSQRNEELAQCSARAEILQSLLSNYMTNQNNSNRSDFEAITRSLSSSNTSELQEQSNR